MARKRRRLMSVSSNEGSLTSLHPNTQNHTKEYAAEIEAYEMNIVQENVSSNNQTTDKIPLNNVSKTLIPHQDKSMPDTPPRVKKFKTFHKKLSAIPSRNIRFNKTTKMNR